MFSNPVSLARGERRISTAECWTLKANARNNGLHPKFLRKKRTARRILSTSAMRGRRIMKFGKLAMMALIVTSISTTAEPLPSRLAGTWRIQRILPTKNAACWSEKDVQPLIGSTLTYSRNSMKWRGGSVPLTGITTRTLTAEEFAKETGSGSNSARFEQLGIHANAVLEVDFQHEDMDITGATTEVPGDSVLLAAPNRIIVSACGVYFEATRAAVVSPTASRSR
jgi:hypothetical protein